MSVSGLLMCILQVYFVDYGFVEVLTNKDLRELDIKKRTLSCCAIKCHLADIVSTGSSDPLHWSATACEYVLSEVKNKTLYIKREVSAQTINSRLSLDNLSK